jgi:N utilization substance protein B
MIIHHEVILENHSIKGKRRARKLALQALYQWQMSGTDLHEIEAQFRLMNDMEKVSDEYFCQLLYGIPANIIPLQEALTPFLDRPVDGLNPIELTTLRIGAFELFHCPDIPYRVVLDEAITLTKEFGSQDGFRYVNGVLNNLAKKTRAIEMNG